MNAQDLSFFYNKKSPTFLVQIVTLISTILLRSYHNSNPQLHRFTTVIMIGCILEITLKTIGLELWSRWCSRYKNFETILIVTFFLYHLAMLIYALILYNNPEYRAKYQHVEPQNYFLRAYVWCYGLIVFGAMLVFVVLGLVGAFCSTKLFKKKHEVVGID